jgi:hypothetical protein
MYIIFLLCGVYNKVFIYLSIYHASFRNLSASECSEMQVKLLAPAGFAVVNNQNCARVVGYGPFTMCDP